MPTELGLVIGAITENQKIIDDALKLEDEAVVLPIYKMIKKYPEKTTQEIYELIYQ